MTTVQRSIWIDASPQDSMAKLSDASRWPQWYPGMTEIHTDDIFPQKGGKVTFTDRMAVDAGCLCSTSSLIYAG